MPRSLLVAVALSWCSVALAGGPDIVVIDDDVTAMSLAGPWLRKAGDDVSWAAPRTDVERGFERFEAPGVWGDASGHVWLRRTVSVPWFDGSDVARARWAKHQPAVAVLGEIGNGWELFAGGERIGAFGTVDGALTLPAPVVVALPDRAVRDGRVVLAWRVFRDTHLPKLDPAYSGMSGVKGPVVVGRLDELTLAARAAKAEAHDDGVAFGPILLVLVLVGLYHLQLFRRRRALREYLWLGLLLITFGVIGTLHTFWWDWLTLNLEVRVKAAIVGGFVVGPLFIAFMRPVLGRTVTRGWRIYIGLQLLFGAVSAVAPGFGFIVASTPVRGALWLPWIGMVIGLVAVEALRKNPEARTMLVGLLLFVASMLFLIFQNLGVIGTIGLNNDMLVLMLGATAFVLSMAVSLSNRFVRVYTALDELNRDLDQTYRAAARFVPTEFMRLIGRSSVREVKLGDQVALPMSILFCDVRGFTLLAEALGPDKTFALINSYLRAMEPAIHAHHGFIRQYLGDGIMALFPGTADDAVAAAIDMHKALVRFNEGREQPLAIGIGINTGPVMLGTIGGQDRLDSGVVGDAVNLASRIEGMTKTYGATIVLGEPTVKALSTPERFSLRPIDRVVAKGRAQALTIVEVEDVLDDEARGRRAKTAARYQEGLAALERGAFTDAKAAFDEVVSADPHDAPARVLHGRAADYAKRPPSDWSGATRLLTK